MVRCRDKLRGTQRLDTFTLVTRSKFVYSGMWFVLALAGAKLAITAAAQAPHDDFHDAVLRAAKLSTLAEPGAPPFHLKLTAQDNTMKKAEYNAEVEIWWAAPDKWRRTVKSPTFTQLAIQNGGHYYESNSAADYLPYWLEELIRGSVDPIPVDALASVPAEEDRPGCGNWEVAHGSGDEAFSTYATMCFNPDGTALRIFAEPVGLELSDYKEFGNKRIAWQLKVSPGGRSEVTALVSVLEPLEKRSIRDRARQFPIFSMRRRTRVSPLVFASFRSRNRRSFQRIRPSVRRLAGPQAIHFPLAASSRSESKSTAPAMSVNSPRQFQRIRPSMPGP